MYRPNGIRQARRSGFRPSVLWIPAIMAVLISGLACQKAAGPEDAPEGRVASGGAFFEQYCSPCHLPDSKENKLGPGFKGLFKRSMLPVSGRLVTEANIRQQLMMPYRDMPSFTTIPEDKFEALIAYLKTL